jgi:hypothetical protein
MYCHVLAARIAGEPPAFRGKPRFCEKNTVKRRKEMNDERKQGNGKTSGVKKALRLKFPDIPSAWGSCSRNTTTNWSGHTHLGERSTLLCTKGAARAGPLTVPPVKLRPFLCFSLYYRHSDLPSNIIPRIPALFLGISILSGVSLSWGAPAPFHPSPIPSLSPLSRHFPLLKYPLPHLHLVCERLSYRIFYNFYSGGYFIIFILVFLRMVFPPHLKPLFLNLSRCQGPPPCFDLTHVSD